MLNDDGLIWRSRFTNTLFLNLKLWPNDTEISLHMTPMTDEPQQQHTAFEKYKYVLAKFMQDSIFIEHKKEEFTAFENLNNEVIDFFSKPVDQVVGVCLLTKLNSIAGEYLQVSAIEIDSYQGENLKFVITQDSPEYTLMTESDIANPWWFEKSPRFSNFTKHTLTWDDLGFKINSVHDRFKIIKGGV